MLSTTQWQYTIPGGSPTSSGPLVVDLLERRSGEAELTVAAWYREAVPMADQRFDEHLKALRTQR